MKNKVKEFLEWKGTYAPRASVNYKIWLERFIQICGEKEVEAYTVTDLVQYHKKIELRFSPYTVQFAMIVVKNFFNYCRNNNLQCLAPWLIKTPRIDAKSHRAVTEEEYLKMIAGIPENEFVFLRDLILIRLLWDTGVRVSELCDLNTSDIDPKKLSAIIKTKKTGRPRVIVWSDETHRLLIKYFGIREELERTNGSSALFIGQAGNGQWSNRMSRRTAQRVVKSYAKKAGITAKVTPHSFRHGWAHKRRDQNAPLAFIQKGLGHINPISTFIYEQYNDIEFETNAKSYLLNV